MFLFAPFYYVTMRKKPENKLTAFINIDLDAVANWAERKNVAYASYQELSFIPVQGLELISTFEFVDPDMELSDNSKSRAGFVVEFFPWAFTELRAMVRRTWDQTSPTGGTWDVVVFPHLFM